MEGQWMAPDASASMSDDDDTVPSTTTDTPWASPPPTSTNLTLTLCPGENQETYVVKVPKDQIYRVPPPENAIYVEQYKNPAKEERTCCKRFMWIFIALLALGILIGVVILVLHILYNPNPPNITITKFLVKPPTNKSINSSYEVSMKSQNPNKKMGLGYNNIGNGGNGVSLFFGDMNIGIGKFPEIFQDVNETETFMVRLAATDEKAPASSKPGVSLGVSIDVDVKVHVGSIHLWNKRLGVTCDLKVSSLEDKTVKLLSQTCESKFK